jgi:hypothetical protein
MSGGESVMDFRFSIFDFGLQALANVDLCQSAISNQQSAI